MAFCLKFEYRFLVQSPTRHVLPGYLWVWVPWRQRHCGLVGGAGTLWASAAFSQAPELSTGQGLRGRARSLTLILRPSGACPVQGRTVSTTLWAHALPAYPMCRWRSQGPRRPRVVPAAMQPESLLEEVLATLLPILGDLRVIC